MWASDYVAYTLKVTEYKASAVESEVLDPSIYLEEDILQELEDPITFAMKATMDPDTLYYHEAMNAPDAAEFKESMVKEVMDHFDRGHWEIIEKKDVPVGEDVLPAVWAMK